MINYKSKKSLFPFLPYKLSIVSPQFLIGIEYGVNMGLELWEVDDDTLNYIYIYAIHRDTHNDAIFLIRYDIIACFSPILYYRTV